MHEERFRQFLGERGLKLTNERLAVLSEALAFQGHFEPETLYDRIRRADIKASRASVYRTINLLVDCGILEKVTQSGRGAVYEPSFGRRHHDHMICNTCGRFIEFFSRELEDLQEKICGDQHFQGTSHTLEIRGICRTCRENQ